MKVVNTLSLKDPVPQATPALAASKPQRVNGLKAPRLVKPAVKGFTPQPGKTSMFGNRAVKSPEDYETAEGVQGLGREASPYFAQQFAKKGRQLRYDTATQTYR